ncbi:hypothetical protein SMU108_07546 [Streptococcus mutans M230]|uniref:hypothetical protein n=1 Tax=Streptococcus mutans TaxID=1309 RepID=UPI0002B589C4|nr:hypothetical protein [Streptococcus mutans]EMC56105.1 hypothetical protein SMU108_07546 [Streptococcus mutans M230]
MADIEQLVKKSVSLGDLDALEKELEKEAIRVLAANYKGRPKGIKGKYDNKVKQAARKTKKALKAISAELDSEIKGQFSKAVTQTIKDKASDYDRL